MDVISCILLGKLCGGPLDGDTFALMPNGSLRPPQRLSYLTTKADQAAWAVYESREMQLGWTEGQTTVHFDFIGTFSANGQERL